MHPPTPQAWRTLVSRALLVVARPRRRLGSGASALSGTQEVNETRILEEAGQWYGGGVFPCPRLPRCRGCYQRRYATMATCNVSVNSVGRMEWPQPTSPEIFQFWLWPWVWLILDHRPALEVQLHLQELARTSPLEMLEVLGEGWV